MLRSFLNSFRYAGKGFKIALREERNLRFHLCMAVYVYLFSFFYDFGRVEYAILTVLIAGVIALELVNSAFERSVSRPSHEKYMMAGAVKDIAAGAVLVFCIGAAACGVFLFWQPAVLKEIFRFFTQHVLWLVLLVLSLVFSFGFVFLWQPGQKPHK